jgi:hypothetical protein
LSTHRISGRMQIDIIPVVGRARQPR